MSQWSLPVSNEATATTTDPEPLNFNLLRPQPWPAQLTPGLESQGEPYVDPMFDSVVSGEFPETNSAETHLQYYLGDPELPTAPYRQFFVETVRNNPISVWKLPTGTGKSTQFCQYLLEAGFNRIYVTQPRIIAARMVAEQVSSQLTDAMGEQAAEIVGWQTSNEGDSSPRNRIQFVTDGLQYMRQMGGDGLREEDVLVIDEAHEANRNQEFLTAVIHEETRKNPNLRVVILSATLDSQKYSKLTSADGFSPALIEINTKPRFELQEYKTEVDVAEAAKKYIDAGKNIQIFVPRKIDVQDVMARLKRYMPADYALLALHGDLAPQLQDQVFRPGKKVIVSTDYGKTSLTNPDLDVVLDTCWERTGILNGSVEGLGIGPASFATMDQRKGRVNRTKDGIYEQTNLDGYPPAPLESQRLDYSRPEIQHRHLANNIAGLALGNYDVDQLTFVNRPPEANLEDARVQLRRLGSLAVAGTLTEMGRNMLSLPVDAEYARMIMEARKYGEPTQLHTIAATSIQQVGSILDNSSGSQRWFHKFSPEQSSDFVYELDVFTAMFQKEQAILKQYEDDPKADADMAKRAVHKMLGEYSIIIRRYEKARDLYRSLAERENVDADILAPINRKDGERQYLIRCQIKGAEAVFVGGKDGHRDQDGNWRQVGRRSSITESAGILIGKPFDLQTPTESAMTTKRFMSGATRVSLAELINQASERITRKELDHHMLPNGEIHTQHRVYFDGTMYVDKRFAKATPTPSLQAFILRVMMTGMAPNRSGVLEPVPFELPPHSKAFVKAYLAALALQHKSHVVKTLLSESKADKFIAATLSSLPEGILDIAELDKHVPKVNLHDFIRPSRRKRVSTIREQAPDSIAIEGQELGVLYRNGKAYITVPQNIKHFIGPDTFASLGVDRYVLARSGRGRYQKLEDYLEKVQIELRRTKEKAAKEEVRLANYAIPEAAPSRDRTNKGITRRRRGPTNKKEFRPLPPEKTKTK